MDVLRIVIASLVLPLLLVGHIAGQEYRWITDDSATESVAERFTAPSGYSRVAVTAGSYADWLRHLPLKPANARVKLYDGSPKANQDGAAAVLALDVGTRDLQQCADAIIRLRAEYLYAHGCADSIQFTFTSGDTATWKKWRQGWRPRVQGNEVLWEQTAAIDSSYENFRQYLISVFTYAGTISLVRDSEPKWSLCEIAAGDFFIQGGSPGHAVLVVDVAEHAASGRKMFLLAQGFTPAQDMHILANPADAALSPWYPCECEDLVITPEWTFACDELRRFE